MRTEDLNFYHGTGAIAARAILASGSRDSLFEEIGARTLGREIRRTLLAHYALSPDEDWRLHSLATGPGSESSSLWVSALRQLDEPSYNNQSLVEYGHFFVTLNIGNAYRYAIGNPYRSEFIRVLAESLKVLNNVGHELPRTVATLSCRPNEPAAVPICQRTRMCSGGCARGWVSQEAETNRQGVCLQAAELDFGQYLNGLAIDRGAKCRVQFFYGHGKAETARKIAAVSVYPANTLSRALCKLAKVELSN
jgi:hypothetical protein